ncbi:MAG: Fic family protein [Candidatus Azotimanducaceae bacterium]|jgi:Fic family protein
MPDQILARAENLESLLNGMIETYQQLKDSEFDAVILAGVIAFGFVFIHPFEDGNGRLHRYLLHHVLADTGFVPRGWSSRYRLCFLTESPITAPFWKNIPSQGST